METLLQAKNSTGRIVSGTWTQVLVDGMTVAGSALNHYTT